MLKEQLKMLDSIRPIVPPIVTIDDLYDKSDRTLIYGYTCDRETHHVYIKDDVIHVALYDGIDKTPLGSVVVTCNQDYIPNKRVYSARSDFEFCALLLRHGVEIRFTEHNELEAKKFVALDKYYGHVLPEHSEIQHVS